MNLVQTGYLGLTGPVFTTGSSVEGKLLLIQGNFSADNKLVLRVKSPAYATALKNVGNFEFSSTDFTLATYQDNEIFPYTSLTFKAPPYSSAFTDYRKFSSDWATIDLTASTTTGVPTNTGTTTTPTNTGSTTGGTTTNQGGSTSGGSTSGGTGTVNNVSTQTNTSSESKPNGTAILVGICVFLAFLVLGGQRE